MRGLLRAAPAQVVLDVVLAAGAGRAVAVGALVAHVEPLSRDGAPATPIWRLVRAGVGPRRVEFLAEGVVGKVAGYFVVRAPHGWRVGVSVVVLVCHLCSV